MEEKQNPQNITLVICPKCGTWKIIPIVFGVVKGNQITFKWDRTSLCHHREPAMFVRPDDKLVIKEREL